MESGQSVEKKVILVVVVFLVAGTSTTCLTKLSNKQESVGMDGVVRPFEHPFLQAWCLTAGEALCFILFFATLMFKARKDRIKGTEVKTYPSFNPLLFLLPSVLHLTSRILIFTGLLITSASSYQMLSGCHLIFTSILTRLFLKMSLPWYKWFGIFVITSGVVIVGVVDITEDKTSLLGNIFVLIGIFFWDCQMVIEEKYVKKYNIRALIVIGLEGSFALIILSILLVALYYIPSPLYFLQGEKMEDALDGFVQLGNNTVLLISFLLTTMSLCCQVITGLAITKKFSSVYKVIVSSVRAIAVWIISLAIGWETFIWLKLLGFLVMIVGVMISNDILIGPILRALLEKTDITKHDDEVKSKGMSVISSVEAHSSIITVIKVHSCSSMHSTP